MSPTFLIQIGGPVVERTEDATPAIYLDRLAIGDANLRILIEQGHQAREQGGFGPVIRFCNPDILPTRFPNAPVPLFERAAAIDRVANNAHAAVFQKRCDDPVTVISRSIIQIDDLKILEGLGEHALYSSPQELGVIVIGDDDSDLLHGYVVLSVAAWRLRSSQYRYD